MCCKTAVRSLTCPRQNWQSWASEKNSKEELQHWLTGHASPYLVSCVHLTILCILYIGKTHSACLLKTWVCAKLLPKKMVLRRRQQIKILWEVRSESMCHKLDTPPEKTTDGQGSEPSCFQQQREKSTCEDSRRSRLVWELRVELEWGSISEIDPSRISWRYKEVGSNPDSFFFSSAVVYEWFISNKQ